ncbi:helix-turn-helix transcriptional regulator [Alishewanella sp. SMS9]|nr:helix-turn-helix transcriptional regulator [Alishewanella sp. SMS9]
MSKQVWPAIAKQLLKERKLKQDALTEALGVETQGAVSHYITGKREITASQLQALAEFFDVTPNDLLGVKSKINETQLRASIESVINTWITKFGQLDWIEYKKDPNIIAELLVSDITDILLKDSASEEELKAQKSDSIFKII